VTPYSQSLLVHPGVAAASDEPVQETEMPALAAPQEPAMDLAEKPLEAEAMHAKPVHA